MIPVYSPHILRARQNPPDDAGALNLVPPHLGTVCSSTDNTLIVRLPSPRQDNIYKRYVSSHIGSDIREASNGGRR